MTKAKELNHQELAPELPESKAPWWEDGKTIADGVQEPAFLAKGIMALWRRMRGWLLQPLAQQDPLTCSEAMLTLLAWERDITRFKGEPLAMFRKRVKFAFINAQDSGEVAGFKRIFERLGIGWCELYERQDGTPWDVITIEVADSAMAKNQQLMETMIQHYGRTCRRYRFQVLYPAMGYLHAGRIDMGHQVFAATLNKPACKGYLRAGQIHFIQHVFGATLPRKES
ncbi:phage tail protein [Aeromonas dhakensis]|uniref:phage tail protein n=1 Tax=Aeromonas dhakensis TaxID=196024 RepID=UPI0028DACA85|nr:phage tail protein [Aeromonas dhakensis]WPS57046.1 phage tail protein [Aeromonas dhakensis]HDZ9210377.1 phage tail protein [Aeromonas dhakensis]